MGLMNIRPLSLLLILLIILCLFGSKRLRSFGEDVGNAIKNFRQALREENDAASKKNTTNTNDEDLL